MSLTFVAIGIAGWARDDNRDTALREARRYGMAGQHGLWMVEDDADFDINPGSYSITAESAVKIGEFHVDDDDVITVTQPENWLNPPRS
tara:strand:+ start:587 stop:853 length:267 start_codon:yes stop_codon:yes gene_type:complete